MSNANRQLAVFRVKMTDILGHYADQMKIFIAENAAMGAPQSAIRAMLMNPASKWAWEREQMIKQIKREVVGLINRIHIAAYLREL